MKITPLDIRQKTFEKQLRGYDKEEVNAFLVYLSQEWEKISEEKNTLNVRLEHAEKEAGKLREVEASLFRTLKTAEDTGASIIEQANKTADIILKEAQLNADALEAASKNRSKAMIESAEAQAAEIMGELKEQVRQLSGNYEKLLEQRESILENLKNLASQARSTAENSEQSFRKVDVSVHNNVVKELEKKPPVSPSYSFEVPERNLDKKNQEDTKENAKTETDLQETDQPSISSNIEDTETKGKEEDNKPPKEKGSSFFDQFD
ncbi:DivIVA domain-containing protein [Pleomorphovibrio marinus]|uniref:DivIVA domain-containing protein n=1 Tax=Pleomorphovibrio marinus TaxID=2164132 RepID=UPI000E0C8032|nr:DivIVA domain-containing protein [Pleomorphovibrio marinus]